MATKETLKATITPSNATNKTVSYTLSDKTLATMTPLTDKSGIEVEANFPGTGTITVETEDSKLKDTADIIVTPILNNDFSQDNTTIYPEWTLGALVWATGLEASTTDRIRTGFIPVVPGTVYKFSENGVAIAFNVFEYKADGTLNPNAPTPINSIKAMVTPMADTQYIRLIKQGVTSVNNSYMITGKIYGSNTLELDSRDGNPNLFKGSAYAKNFTVGSNNGAVYPVTTVIMTEGMREFCRIYRTSPELNPDLMYLFTSFNLKEAFTTRMFGQKITASFKVRANVATTATLMVTVGNPNLALPEQGTVINIGTEWTTASVTFTIPDDDTKTFLRVNPFKVEMQGLAGDFYMDICEYKFEFGEVATPWAPAPEDYGVPHGYPNLLNNGNFVTNVNANSTFGVYPLSYGTHTFVDNVLHFEITDDSNLPATRLEIRIPNLTIGLKYTIRVSIKNSRTLIWNNSVGVVERYPLINMEATDTFTVSTYTFTTTATEVTLRGYFQSGVVLGDTYDIRDVKLSLGTEAGDWTPSFADFSAGKYDFNPYREATPDEYALVKTDDTTKSLRTNSVIYDTKGDFKVTFDTLSAVISAYPEKFSGTTTIAQRMAIMKSLVKSIRTKAYAYGLQDYCELHLLVGGTVPISSETARNFTGEHAELLLEPANVKDYFLTDGKLIYGVTTWNTGTTTKNLFSFSKFNETAVPHPKVPMVNYINMSLLPNTQYTASTSDIPETTNQNVWFCLPSESPMSGTNGVKSDAPRTITTGADGVVTLAIRNGTFSADAGVGKLKVQVEQGATATGFDTTPFVAPVGVDMAYIVQEVVMNPLDPNPNAIPITITVKPD